MGGRGAFIDIDKENWTFREGGQTFFCQSVFYSKVFGDVKILMQNQPNVRVPLYSHSANKIYAVIKNKKLKHIAFYDEVHKQKISVDLLHKHNGIIPHKHLYNDHNHAFPITQDEQELIDQIKKEFHLI